MADTDIRSSVSSGATTVDELRAEGVYQILTPDACVALATELGPFGAITHHPLCGATPANLGWASLRAFRRQGLAPYEEQRLRLQVAGNRW